METEKRQRHVVGGSCRFSFVSIIWRRFERYCTKKTVVYRCIFLELEMTIVSIQKSPCFEGLKPINRGRPEVPGINIIVSLKLTSFLHLKNGWSWKTFALPFGAFRPIFRGHQVFQPDLLFQVSSGQRVPHPRRAKSLRWSLAPIVKRHPTGPGRG